MSTNRYNSGYSNGVSDADGRSNPSSYNYQTGYNAGYNAGASASKSISWSFHKDGDASGSDYCTVTIAGQNVVDRLRSSYDSTVDRSGTINV